jgi:hypothetical protein
LNKNNQQLFKKMIEILEVPIDPPEPAPEPPIETDEIQNNVDITGEIPAEPETPAPKKKGRGRPAGAKNKAKPKARLPSPEPEPVSGRVVDSVPHEYYSPPPVDPTTQLLGRLKNHMDQRHAMKRQKYAGWVGRF